MQGIASSIFVGRWAAISSNSLISGNSSGGCRVIAVLRLPHGEARNRDHDRIRERPGYPTGPWSPPHADRPPGRSAEVVRLQPLENRVGDVTPAAADGERVAA